MNVQVVVVALATAVAVKSVINTKDVMAVCSNAVYQLPGSFYVQGAGTIHKAAGKNFSINILAELSDSALCFHGHGSKGCGAIIGLCMFLSFLFLNIPVPVKNCCSGQKGGRFRWWLNRSISMPPSDIQLCVAVISRYGF